MLIQWIKVKAKKILPIDSVAYRVLRNVFYEYKSLVDFLSFKIKYPRAEWYKFFGRKDVGYSQFGQDQYLIKITDNKELSYVEIGANHPTRLSNTLLLEESGWSGISIDPLKKYEHEWANTRKGRFICMAVGAETGERDFIEFSGSEDWIDMMSGFKEYVRQEDYLTFDFRSYKVKMDRLSTIVGDYEFDLLLVDTEGAEIEILKGVDFSICKPRFILIENAQKIGGGSELRAILHSYGYEVVARIGGSDDLLKRVEVIDTKSVA